MNYEQVNHKFIDKPIYKLVNPDTIQLLQKKILQKWKPTKKKTFPGPQPVSLERKDFKMMKEQQYIACAKLDGERFFMYAC